MDRATSLLFSRKGKKFAVIFVRRRKKLRQPQQQKKTDPLPRGTENNLRNKPSLIVYSCYISFFPLTTDDEQSVYSLEMLTFECPGGAAWWLTRCGCRRPRTGSASTIHVHRSVHVMLAFVLSDSATPSLSMLCCHHGLKVNNEGSQPSATACSLNQS